MLDFDNKCTQETEMEGRVTTNLNHIKIIYFKKTKRIGGEGGEGRKEEMGMEGGMQGERVREREKMMYRFTQIIQQVV